MTKSSGSGHHWYIVLSSKIERESFLGNLQQNDIEDMDGARKGYKAWNAVQCDSALLQLVDKDQKAMLYFTSRLATLDGSLEQINAIDLGLLGAFPPAKVFSKFSTRHQWVGLRVEAKP